jgi:protein TonB
VPRPRPEGSDGAARTRSQSSLPSVDVIVLTADPALLATLREAAGPAHEIFHADSPEAAVELLIGGRCGLFIVDVGLVRSRAVDLIDNLKAQFPEVLLLAAGRRDEQHAVASLVGDGRIYRFLHKPVSPARAELFLSAATRRYGELHPHDARAHLASDSPAMPRNRKTVLLAAAIALLIAIAAAWLTAADRAERGGDSRAASSASALAVSQLMTRADAALAQGNVAPPAADNALDLYRAALRIDANNEHARQAIEGIIATLERNMNDALAARDAPRARNAFTTLQRAAPDHPRLDELEAALFALARQASAAASKQESKRAPRQIAPAPASAPTVEATPPSTDPAPEPPPEAAPTVERAALNELLERAIRLRQQGQLIEPQGDNAVEALQAALTADPSSAEVNRERQRLSITLLDNTRTALVAGEIDRADVLATRAEEVLPGLPQAKALREQIGAARMQRQEAASVLQAATLRRTREVPAVYPREARLSSTEGWVDLEFMISADGMPSDIVVKASEPRRVFDAAAIQALRQWRFAPIAHEGAPRARRALLRMEFKLER